MHKSHNPTEWKMRIEIKSTRKKKKKVRGVELRNVNLSTVSEHIIMYLPNESRRKSEESERERERR